MDQLLVEIEDHLDDPDRVAEELQLRLGLKVEVRAVPLGTLPRFEGKGTRLSTSDDHHDGPTARPSPTKCGPAAPAAHWPHGRHGARGFVQANLVILPQAEARDFAEFCRLNDRPCPSWKRPRPAIRSRALGAGRGPAQRRSSLPDLRSRRADARPADGCRSLWRDDFVAFLLGCSFTFETALEAAGLPVRHIHEAATCRCIAPVSPACRRGALPVRWWSACVPTLPSRLIR